MFFSFRSIATAWNVPNAMWLILLFWWFNLLEIAFPLWISLLKICAIVLLLLLWFYVCCFWMTWSSPIAAKVRLKMGQVPKTSIDHRGAGANRRRVSHILRTLPRACMLLYVPSIGRHTFSRQPWTSSPFLPLSSQDETESPERFFARHPQISLNSECPIGSIDFSWGGGKKDRIQIFLKSG